MDLSFGNSPIMFGHADYYQAMRRGMGSEAILNWLNRHNHTLSSNNKPGQGGLYDEISRAATNERDMRFKSDFENRMKEINMQMAQQRSSYQQQLAQQTTGYQKQLADMQSGYQQQLSDVNNSLLIAKKQANAPQATQRSLGVKAAGSKSPKENRLKRQGMAGSFGREGLRISSLNI